MSGISKYFTLHDGCAVTTEDFIEAIVSGASEGDNFASVEKMILADDTSQSNHSVLNQVTF